MKNLKTASSTLNYDGMTDNVDQMKELVAKVEDIKRIKQKKIEEREELTGSVGERSARAPEAT